MHFREIIPYVIKVIHFNPERILSTIKTTAMESQRQSKVSRLIQKELGDIFQKQGNTLFGGGMISVTVVRMTPDLGIAKVYISVFPPQRREELFETVNNQVKTLRHELGRRVKNQLRHVPELHFYVDDSMDYVQRIDDLLNS